MQFRASGHSIGRHVLLASTSLSTGNDTSEDEACDPACQTTSTDSLDPEPPQDKPSEDEPQPRRIAGRVGRFLKSKMFDATLFGGYAYALYLSKNVRALFSVAP